MPIILPFSSDEVLAANEAWFCNCGPAALAFALQCPLDNVRPIIPGFEQKRYTNIAMMRSALATAERRFWEVKPPNLDRMFPQHESASRIHLVRVQWTGEWRHRMEEYRHTHWICSWTERNVWLVFDINGGIMSFAEWEREIVPAITAEHKGADGDWKPTHIWRIARA